MKKLMIGAAVAAITVGAFAGACDDTEPEKCFAWDVKMSLKTLGPKKITCKESGGPCEDGTKSTVYYMDTVSRKIVGYFWLCDYECEAMNAVLWDKKNKKAVIAYANDGKQADTSKLVVYGKKATKVAGSIEIAGEDVEGNPGIEVTAAGVNGKLHKDGTTECYVKSLSGHVAGLIAYIKPGYVSVTRTTSLCEDEVVIDDCSELAKLIPFCDACCFEGWCTADDWDDLVPAVGTWSMKYNKKVAAGKKGSMASLVPAYAL